MDIYSLHKSLSSITVEDVSKYLKRNAWRQRKDYSYENLVVFENIHPDFESNLTAVFPSNRKFRDFEQRVSELILLLSKIEDRPVNDIVFDMVKSNTDRVEIRIRKDNHNLSSPLPIITEIIKSTRKLIQSTINNELEPRSYIRKSRSKGIEISNDFLFDFSQDIYTIVVAIESPNRGIHRRVVNRLRKGIVAFQNNIPDRSNYSEFRLYQEGFNLNMCNDFIKLFNIIPSNKFDLSFRYSHVRNPNYPSQETEISIDAITVQAIEKSLNLLKEPMAEDMEVSYGKSASSAATDLIDKTTTLDVFENYSIEGYILQLTSRSRNGILNGTIRVLWNNRIIEIDLELNLYRKACDAHRDGHRVKVIGSFESRGTQMYLLKLDEFRVLD